MLNGGEIQHFNIELGHRGGLNDPNDIYNFERHCGIKCGMDEVNLERKIGVVTGAVETTMATRPRGVMRPAYVGCPDGKYDSMSRPRRRHLLRRKATVELREKFARVSGQTGTIEWSGGVSRRKRRELIRELARGEYSIAVKAERAA